MMMMDRQFPGPPPEIRIYGSDNESDSDGMSAVEELSDISDRELDYIIQDKARREREMVPTPRPPEANNGYRSQDDEFERDPWNAVAVVGLRIFYKVAPEDKDKEVVTLRVVRPSLYDLDGDDDAKKNGSEEEKKKGDDGDDKEGTNESKVLDLDDSAKDATIVV
jgi:hypothetical protein